jgi:phosphatidylglycerol:prolipoprotein diacylglycerol transferase
MLIHPQIDPVAIALGPIAIHWYGLTYLAAFALFVGLGHLRLKHEPYAAQVVLGSWSKQDVEDILFYGVMGVVLGGRIGYCLFYNPSYYLMHPLEVFAVWQGGMSFHGGMLGVAVATGVFAWQRHRPWLWVTDFVVPCVPTGLAAGRVGNFINGELWGRAADLSLPWAMVFPQSGSLIARHPSQIYQFLGEGVFLFIVLWLYARKPRAIGAVSGVFMIGYGTLRFMAEYFREPDAHLGLLALGMTMGQWLCVPMVGIGMWLWLRANRHPETV